MNKSIKYQIKKSDAGKWNRRVFKLEARQVYGRVCYFPLDELGKTILQLFYGNRKCFLKNGFEPIRETLKELGFEAEIQLTVVE